MYDSENEFVTRFWGPIDNQNEYAEDDFRNIVAKLENSTDIFFSIHWESGGAKYGIDIPYERFKLALKEAGITEISIFPNDSRRETE